MSDVIDTLRAALALPGQGSSDYDLNPEAQIPKGREIRPAAVLVPLVVQNGHARLILTKRASALKHHPGQIAFPGGKVDAQDENDQATALREAHEEIGLPPASVEIIGQLPQHVTVTGFRVTPIIGVIQKSFQPKADPAEVEEIFDLPLNHVLRLENYNRTGRYWQGAIRRYETVPYGPYYIWGATARMLRMLAQRVPQ